MLISCKVIVQSRVLYLQTRMMVNEVHRWTNVFPQYLASFIANLIGLDQGLTLGWFTPALAVLVSEKTPLASGPMSHEQISWVGSIGCFGSIFGSIVFGYIISTIGCKRAMVFLSIPSIGFWLLIYFGTHYYHVLFARFCVGWVLGGSASSIMLYVAEIANDDIRGRLGSLPLFVRNIGILLSIIIGTTVDYKYVPCICVFVPIIFAILMSSLSNTPQYYLHREKPHKAENALKHYKGCKGCSEQEENALYHEFERLKMIAMQRKADDKVGIADLLNREALKGVGFGMTLIFFSQCAANLPSVSYSMLIFKEAGAFIDPYIASIILAVALILGSLVTGCLADTIGRKLLNIISLTGSAIGLFSMSTYQYLRLIGYDLSDFEWIPVAVLSFVIFISSAGIIPLSTVCSIEYIPSKIRTSGMTIISLALSLTAFASLKTFPILLKIAGLHGCFFIYAIGCCIGAVFILCVQKETSGQCIDKVDTNAGLKDNIDSSNKVEQPLIYEQN